MAKAELDDFSAAVLTLSPDDMGADGSPKVAPLNAALNAAGFDDVTAAGRDDLWSQHQAAQDDTDDTPTEFDDAEDAPEGSATITLIASPCNPLPLYVHGVGRFSIRVGETATLPREALDALHNSGGVEYSLEG
jgi:hypothetical protein